jgi:hypothetical protein
VTAALALAGCVEDKPGITGTTSLRVEVTAPTDLGSAESRLPDGDRNVTVQLTALDQDGQPDPTLSTNLDVYVHFLGTLTPDESKHVPLVTIPMQNGVGTATLPLDIAYGATLVWVEDANREGATFATGVSPEIWFRDPFLDDVGRPVDENSLDALAHSPLEGKQVKIEASRFGDAGQLVVTGVYAQGYTVSDVKTADKTVPAYGHGFIFTFGRPRAADGRAIEVGHVVKAVSGGISEFNGLTEFNFPQTELVAGAADAARVQPPAVLSPEWLTSSTGPNGMINLERLESGLVAVDNGKVCDVASDPDYAQYGQWKLDVGSGCGKPYNVITKGQVSDFDPADYVGMTLPRVVGTLRAVNIGTFSVWIVQPRTLADITTN